MNLLPGSIRQFGYVVENVDAAVVAWSRLGIEVTPALQEMFAQGIAAAAGWDGHRAPTVIDFASLAQQS